MRLRVRAQGEGDRGELGSMDSTPEWHQNEDTARDGDGWLSGVFEMVGCEEIFSGIDSDAYVRQLREGWG